MKGVSGPAPAAELSANEFAAMTRAAEGRFKEGEYRLAIVSDALGKRNLHLFRHDGGDRWLCELTGKRIAAQPRTAARLG